MISFSGLVAGPLFMGCIFAATALVLWWHDNHWQRFTAWCFAASAACFTLAIPAVLDALAALTLSTRGLIVLAVADLIIIPAFYLQAIRTNKKSRIGGLLRRKGGGVPQAMAPVSRQNQHKPVLTPLIGVLAGAFGVVTFGAARILIKHASVAATGTVTALAQSAAKVNDGTAGQQIARSHLQGTWLVLAGGFLVLAFVMWIAHKRKRKSGKGISGGRGGQPVMRMQSR